MSQTLCVGQACGYAVRPCSPGAPRLTIAATAVVVLLSIVDGRKASDSRWRVSSPTDCSASGAMLVPAATDLVTLLVAIEVVSLPTFALIAMNRGDRRSGEGALKAFLYSVTSVAVSFYGVALLYGSLGTVSFFHCSFLLGNTEPTPIATAGLVLVLAVIAFKAAAVPFHAWAPDAYEGAPDTGGGLPIGRFEDVGFAALPWCSRLLCVVHDLGAGRSRVGRSHDGDRQRHRVFGRGVRCACLRGRQSRKPATSSCRLPPSSAGLVGGDGYRAAVIGYLVGYAALNLGAFAVVRSSQGRIRARIADFTGLAWRSPWLGMTLAFFLAGLAGLPPALIGLFIKVQVIAVPVSTGAWWLASRWCWPR